MRFLQINDLAAARADLIQNIDIYKNSSNTGYRIAIYFINTTSVTFDTPSLDSAKDVIKRWKEAMGFFEDKKEGPFR